MADQGMLTKTLVALADTLVDDFDVIDLLTLLVDRSVDVLQVSAAGLMLLAPEGDLRIAASSSDTVRVLELFELQTKEGPCVECHRTGEPVVNQDLSTANSLWPAFAPVALESGFRCAHAIPMRLRGRAIGALNLFSAEVRVLSDNDIDAAQALADMATISILQTEAAAEAKIVSAQLNHALTSRIVIEQAKGVLAERVGVGMAEAFARLRHYARSNNLRLADVALDVVNGVLSDPAFSRPGPAETS